MKRSGIIHGDLAGHVARLGHTDLVVVADAGLPIPTGVRVVDLALVYGQPRFNVVLDALLAELVVEHAWISEEVAGSAPERWIESRLEVTVDRVPHHVLKRMVSEASLVVRTGEDTPYANVVLRCGVPF